ncbi:MAG: ATP-binding cassette domain-containing protein, partial [Desulfobacterales bacterium]|nr:ATP-binding cassette domain-containing protein [Desulfobacterales bacterium]
MLFEIAQLTKTYHERTILDVRQLDIEKGSIYGLQGPNGAGKTTLLNILAFLERPSTGLVSYKSELVQYAEPYLQRYRKEVVLVDQLPLLFTTTVFKNMEFGLKIRGLPKEERSNLSDIRQFRVMTPSGAAIPLDELAEVSFGTA